ncbi:MAG TPA: tetratricopeptide repeat protein, partial [Gemmatimonadales bacterium]|nr:tetratricopeptide repeat protein [Gemmatimonadales bacterium]
ALIWAEKWIAFGQRPEAAYRALMSAHGANGDMSRVAATYERCVKTLKDFGVEPSEQTRLLYEELKSGKARPQVRAAVEPAHVTTGGATNNIPVPLTSFVGRERDLKEIAKLLHASRLVTLTGPGGVGKTRLAIEAAGQALTKFKDGVLWVSLASLSEPGLIPQELAQALQVREVASEALMVSVLRQLKVREALLVLDNCEHLIRACAQVAEQLLGECPRLKILATSIEGLGLFNETVWQVPSLPLPEERLDLTPKELDAFEGIRLFHERAENAASNFALNEQNAAAVVQICKRLDGIPLAIELAAARTRMLSVEEIASRLDDRFSLLTAGSRTAIPRHQTLRAAIDWSHDLLTEPERVLLRRLSVFSGGFTLGAAEAVCSTGLATGEVLDLLGRLVGKSLIAVDSSDSGETRYRLLETIRQYALEKLMGSGEASQIRDRHIEFYLGLAETAESELFAPDSGAWFRRLDREFDNLRSAIEWATASGKADLALRILGALVYFWFGRGLPSSDWNDRLRQALAKPEGQKRSLARAKALNGISFMYWADFNPSDQFSELEEALSIGEELQDAATIASAMSNFGLRHVIRSEFPQARRALEKSLEVWNQVGSPGRLGRAHTLIFLGDVSLSEGDLAQARGLYAEGRSIYQSLGDINFMAYVERRLGHLAWLSGDLEAGKRFVQESLDLNLRVMDPRGLCACLAGFMAIAVAAGDHRRAAMLAGATERQLTTFGIRLLYVDSNEFDQRLKSLSQELDEKTLVKQRAKGARMSLDEALAFASHPAE